MTPTELQQAIDLIEKYEPLTPRELEVCSLGAVLPATLQKYKIEYQKAYNCIAELQKVIDDYEERLKRLLVYHATKYNDGTQYDVGYSYGLEYAVEIMTGEDGE